MNDPQLIYRVYLVRDPSTHVIVYSTVSRRAQTYRKIHRDIRNQKFARWAPFAGGIDGQDWRWCFVNEAGQRVDIDGNLHPDQTPVL